MLINYINKICLFKLNGVEYEELVEFLFDWALQEGNKYDFEFCIYLYRLVSLIGLKFNS